MALFQRKPQTSDPKMFYTVGLNRTVLMVGLGNPGKAYDLTRHNVGFLCVDNFVSKTDGMEPWQEKKSLKSLVSTGRIGDSRIIVIKPTTFMNLSGEAVQKVVQFYKLSNQNIVVVHDELDIDFGQIRLRVGGSAAGHNGIKSVSEAIGEDYGRVRIGIGPKKPVKMKSEDFVLQKFSADQQEQLANLTREVTAILSEFTFGGGMLEKDTRSFLV